MRGIRHVIWDWNGTLLDDAWLCVDVMNELLLQRGLPQITLADYAALFRFPVRDYYTALGFDFEREPFERVGTAFIEGYAAREAACGLRAGADEILTGVAARGATQS